MANWRDDGCKTVDCDLRFRVKSCATAISLLMLLVVNFFAGSAICAQNATGEHNTVGTKLPDMDNFTGALEKLLTKYYPKIQRTRVPLDPGVVQFEYNTMKFMIHSPLKTGEWQPARETLGPQRHGVICGVRVNAGKYMGAAMVPQVFDHRYYNTLLMAPYSETKDCHLHATLSYPEADVDSNFLREYQRLINSFQDYLK